MLSTPHLHLPALLLCVCLIVVMALPCVSCHASSSLLWWCRRAVPAVVAHACLCHSGVGTLLGRHCRCCRLAVAFAIGVSLLLLCWHALVVVITVLPWHLPWASRCCVDAWQGGGGGITVCCHCRCLVPLLVLFPSSSSPSPSPLSSLSHRAHLHLHLIVIDGHVTMALAMGGTLLLSC